MIKPSALPTDVSSQPGVLNLLLNYDEAILSEKITEVEHLPLIFFEVWVSQQLTLNTFCIMFNARNNLVVMFGIAYAAVKGNL